MKFAIFIFLVSVASCFAENEDTYYYPKDSSNIFMKEVSKCVDDFGYDSSVIDQIRQGKYIEEDNTVNILLCSTVNTGYGYTDGKLNVEKVIKEFYPTKQNVRPILEECNKEHGTPLITFKSIVTCLTENLPFKVRFPS